MIYTNPLSTNTKVCSSIEEVQSAIGAPHDHSAIKSNLKETLLNMDFANDKLIKKVFDILHDTKDFATISTTDRAPITKLLSDLDVISKLNVKIPAIERSMIMAKSREIGLLDPEADGDSITSQADVLNDQIAFYKSLLYNDQGKPDITKILQLITNPQENIAIQVSPEVSNSTPESVKSFRN